MSIWRWAKRFSEVPAEHRVTLGEGDTPLLCSARIGPAAGLERLYFKLETVNPTGSYKDRFAAAAVADMLARGKRRIVGTSSGNTGAALAAYAAKAGIACELAIIVTAPEGKLRQMRAYGATLYKVRGFGLDAAITTGVFEALKRKGNAPDAQLQISAFCHSPVGMAGVRTIGYEIAEQLPGVGHVFVPAGGGGLTLAVACGLAQTDVRPRVHCVQPAGNDTIASPLRDGADHARAVVCTTQIGGLQVPSVMDGQAVIAACRASGGTGHVVTDEQVWSAQGRLAREEGVFCEPAGAVALAAALQAVKNGELARHDPVVCLVTGVGFKDMDAVERMIGGGDCPLIEPNEVERR